MKITIALVLMLSSSTLLHAEETVGEQIQAKANNVSRTVKEGVDKMKEMACKESDSKCLAKKAKHKAKEASDTVKDKTKEIANKVD